MPGILRIERILTGVYDPAFVPLISIILPARNAPQWTGRALASIRHSLIQLGWLGKVEMILLDDNSDPALGIAPLFSEFRRQSKIPCKIIRFKEHQHYSRIFGAGLSVAQGDKVFFLSNDMIFTPDFFRVLMEISNLDKSIGIVRGTANYVDGVPQYAVAPPKAWMTFDDILAFSQSIALQHGHELAVDSLLTGDAVLINRADRCHRRNRPDLLQLLRRHRLRVEGNEGRIQAGVREGSVVVP